MRSHVAPARRAGSSASGYVFKVNTAKWAYLAAFVTGGAGLVACGEDGLYFPDGFKSAGGASSGGSAGSGSAGKAAGGRAGAGGANASGRGGQAGNGSGETGGSTSSMAGTGGGGNGAGGSGATGGDEEGGEGGTSASAGKGGSAQGGASSGGSNSGGKAGSAQGGSTAAGGSGGSGAPAGLVPAFMAIGHQQRSTISCDDGRTWTHDQAADDTECWGEDSMPDCDHSPYAGRGLTYGNGWFVGAWGWGDPGTIRRTKDGVTWETVMDESPTFAGLAYGKSTFVADGSPAFTSTDAETWDEQGDTKLGVLYRGIGFVPYDGGRFIAVGQDGDNLAISHSADGKTWTKAADNGGCGKSFLGIAGNADIAVLSQEDGGLCWSDDGGANWTRTSAGSSLTSNPIWTGTEFLVYNRARLYRSANGKTWTNEATVPNDLDLGQIARSPEGTFVAGNHEWQHWYDSQEFYRSTDGKNWESLSSDAFTGSHPVKFVQFGYVEAGAGCE